MAKQEFDYEGFAARLNENLQRLAKRVVVAGQQFDARQEMVGLQENIDDSDIDTFLRTYRLRAGLKTAMEVIPDVKEDPRFRETYESLSRDIEYLESIVRIYMKGYKKPDSP